MKLKRSAFFFLSISAFVILSLLLLGMVLVKSPSEMKLVRMDERRVADLHRIGNLINRYYQNNRKLPEDLKLLTPSNDHYLPLFDPETEEPYKYRIMDSKSYEVCAVFSASNLDQRTSVDRYIDGEVYDMRHGSGTDCLSVSMPSSDN